MATPGSGREAAFTRGYPLVAPTALMLMVGLCLDFGLRFGSCSMIGKRPSISRLTNSRFVVHPEGIAGRGSLRVTPVRAPVA